VLVVGAGNTGAEIALEVASGHPTWLSGRDTHHVPFRIETVVARHLLLPLIFRVIGHHVLTVNTPLGRKARRKALSAGAPLVRVKPRDLAEAGVDRVPRVAGVRDGLPALEDQRILEVTNVIWCTGFRPDFSWIDLPVFGEERREPLHHRGRGRERAGAVLRRPALPLRDVVGISPRGRQGRGTRRETDCVGGFR
jgi:putative flavoprotein involved in K+ transport